MTGSVILNLLITLCAAASVAHELKQYGAGPVLRYFTVLSNLFCAVTALLVAVFRLFGEVPNSVLILKHIGTSAVAVTLLVVLVYLGPAVDNYFSMFYGSNLFLHLLCPLMAIVSRLLWDKPEGGFGIVLLGVLPVIVYGIFYMIKVLVVPEKKRWDDFYGFTRGGKWWLSFLLVALTAFVSSLVFWLAG